LFAVGAINAIGGTYTWDPEGTATNGNINTSGYYSASLSGTWESASWSTQTTEKGQAVPVVWAEGSNALFAAYTGTGTPAFTVTMNSNHTVAGFFDGPDFPNPCPVTLTGTGIINLPSGMDYFYITSDTGDPGSLTISNVVAGPGSIYWYNTCCGVGTLVLDGQNTFTGGIILNAGGVVGFGNNSAFGTGSIQMTSSSAGVELLAEGTSARTIANPIIAASAAMNIMGNIAGVTFTGPWTLSATPMIGSGGVPADVVTLSGAMSGVGGFTKYNPGTLVLGGSNSYAGTTTISNGVLSITADNNLGAIPAVANYSIYLSGGTLNCSNSFTLNQNRLIFLTANSSIGVSTGNTLAYGGTIGGSFVLTKSGAGTLALSGAAAYTGTTTISAGTLEADTSSGSATGTNSVSLAAAGTLSGSGIVSGPVSGAGTIAPGTSNSPAVLTLGNGLNLSSGGTYAWNLGSNSTSTGYSSISLLGGNLVLGGSSKLSLNFSGAATAPSTNNPFWLTQEAWTVLGVSGSAGDPGATQFTSIVNGTYAAGSFSNYTSGGNIFLVYLPKYAAFETLSDSGPGFVSGENLILTNFSGLTLYVWSATNASLSVSNWFLEGPMSEQSLAPGLPGYSRYSINVNPSVSPTYYVAGNINTGPFISSPVPAAILTTEDFVDFNVVNTNVSINAAGVLGLLPSPPVILPGSVYSGGQFQFQFSADMNQHFTVQGSTDLVTWSNISSGTISSSPMPVIDSDASHYPSHFYRVTLP